MNKTAEGMKSKGGRRKDEGCPKSDGVCNCRMGTGDVSEGQRSEVEGISFHVGRKSGESN